MKAWYSRASSHSTTYVSVGLFRSAEEAEGAADAIKEKLEGGEDSDAVALGRKVYARVYSDSDPELEVMLEGEGATKAYFLTDHFEVRLELSSSSKAKLRATVIMTNLLHSNVLSPGSYVLAEGGSIKGPDKDGAYSYIISGYTTDVDGEPVDKVERVKGVRVEDLEALGCNVSVDYA